MTDQVLGYSVLNQNRENVYVTRNLAKRVGECKHYIIMKGMYHLVEGKYQLRKDVCKREVWDIVDVKEREDGVCFMHIQRKVGNVLKMALRMFHVNDEFSDVGYEKDENGNYEHKYLRLTITGNTVYAY